MIILKKHFKGKDTAIYGDVVSNGCQTFCIYELDKVCEEFKVSEKTKQEVIKYHQENQGVDDMSVNILDALKSEDNDTLNRAVVFGTENLNLLEEMMSYFDYDLQMKMVVANRKNLPKKLIEQLAKDENIDIRLAIAERDDLDNLIIKLLVNDESSGIRTQIARRKNLRNYIIKQLSKDKNRYVRLEVAKRSNLSPSIIQKLMKDDAPIVRCSIAKRVDLSDDMIKILSSLAVKHRPLGR